MEPLLRVKNKKGDYVYFEAKVMRPCRLCARALDPNDKFVSLDAREDCRAFEVKREDFLNLHLHTLVFTDCLQHLQNWAEIKR